MCDALIPVALDKDLVDKLLNGLYSGAEGRMIKVVIDTEGGYHVTSKGLSIVLGVDSSGSVKSIDVSNEKYCSVITAGELAEMNLLTFANRTYKILREKYSPYFHSLADNIVLFSRAYWNSSIDEK
jgi:hypothetical protein